MKKLLLISFSIAVIGCINNKPDSKNQLPKKEVKIDTKAAEIINNLSPDKKKIMLQALSIKSTHSGPLPDGETIRIYNEVIPDGGNRLMATVEKQLQHRIEMENKGLKRSFNQSSTGQWMGFIIALAFGFFAWDLAKSGYQEVAAIIGVIDIVGLVVVFVIGKKK